MSLYSSRMTRKIKSQFFLDLNLLASGILPMLWCLLQFQLLSSSDGNKLLTLNFFNAFFFSGPLFSNVYVLHFKHKTFIFIILHMVPYAWVQFSYLSQRSCCLSGVVLACQDTGNLFPWSPSTHVSFSLNLNIIGKLLFQNHYTYSWGSSISSVIKNQKRHVHYFCFYYSVWNIVARG